MNPPQSPLPTSSSRARNIALVAVAVSVAAVAGWSAASRRASNPAPATASASPTVSAAIPGVAVAASPETPEQILKSIPDSPAAVPGAEVKKVDGEITKWKDKARTRPNEPTYWVNLGDALMQKARETVEPHYYDFAEKSYARSLAIASKNPEAQLGMAWVTSTRHQFTDSIAWAEKALAVAPQLHAAHGLIGDAQVETGDYDAAFESYQKMLDIRPDISSYSRGARILYLTGDTRKAIWLMDKAVKTGGPYAENTAWCRAQLAEMYLDTGAAMVAEQTLKQALKATPDNYHVLAAMGRARQMRGDLKGAIASYEKAVTVTPQHNALIALGDLYQATGDKARAEKLFAQVDAAHEHYLKHGVNGELYMARFWADHDRQMDRALKIAQAATDVSNPVDADAAAWVFYKSGKNAEAKTMIDKALATGAPDAMRLFHAGMIYAKAGERVPAQKYLYQALNRNPHFSLTGAEEAAATLKQLGGAKTPVAGVSRG